MRSSRNVLFDVGLRDQLANLLFCITSAWLKLGFETVFGEFIPVQNFRGIEATLRSFIMSRVLSNEEIDSEFVYSESSKAQPFFNPGRATALERFALKKILLVLFFVDQAKANRIMDSDPCLFNKVG